MDRTSGGIPKAAIERLLRDELASWLEVGLGKSRLLDTYRAANCENCAIPSGVNVRKRAATIDHVL